MSKNVLKQSQDRREEKQSEDEGEPTSDRDRLRDELLQGEAKDEQPTKRLNAEIPAGLHERFKATCKREGVSMTTALVSLLETYTDLKSE
jgi:hypothetical protein